ncbi:N-acetyltransferase family protein [Sporomusa carbonis]|uniref:GNAT family N-acetyltransferase n=1 Tax=Sporomusa carbonis TaxID=3076075 RepID=UPI003C7BB2D3
MNAAIAYQPMVRGITFMLKWNILAAVREGIGLISNFTVRKARPEDVDSMIKLLRLLFSIEEDFCVDETKQRRGLEMLLPEDTNRCLLVAEHNQQVIGMCSAQLVISTAEGGWKALVEDVVIAENYRGCGLGRQLLTELEKWAASQGAKRLDLFADRHNAGGLLFYDKMKWQHTNLIVLQKKL